jgi:hypothetical protein
LDRAFSPSSFAFLARDKIVMVEERRGFPKASLPSCPHAFRHPVSDRKRFPLKACGNDKHRIRFLDSTEQSMAQSAKHKNALCYTLCAQPFKAPLAFLSSVVESTSRLLWPVAVA